MFIDALCYSIVTLDHATKHAVRSFTEIYRLHEWIFSLSKADLYNSHGFEGIKAVTLRQGAADL